MKRPRVRRQRVSWISARNMRVWALKHIWLYRDVLANSTVRLFRTKIAGRPRASLSLLLRHKLSYGLKQIRVGLGMRLQFLRESAARV